MQLNVAERGRRRVGLTKTSKGILPRSRQSPRCKQKPMMSDFIAKEIVGAIPPLKQHIAELEAQRKENHEYHVC
jgi:hypothetical protein